jgi:hypothetical protein
MKREAGGPCLSAVFVDYDNIYLSLKRKSEEAAKRFAKDAATWLREIETGRLITPTNAPFADAKRRIVMNRCYGNPVPRRNAHDNSTDMNSFPFVRHHFLRAGFEVIDCPPLTAQLKNSSDIRMVMDVRDFLTHETYFDEFIILSGDADFTPVLIRLRAHARRTVIFANDFTAAPYTAISDGEVREADLIALIMGGQLTGEGKLGEGLAGLAPAGAIEAARREIVGEVAAAVRSAAAPVPLEALADRAVRALGHDKTIATGWAGAGSFRELLRQSLPEDIRVSGEPPYLAADIKRHRLEASRPPALQGREASPELAPAGGASLSSAPDPLAVLAAQPAAGAAALAHAPSAIPQRSELATPIQQSIARIHEACQAPAMAPHEYRTLFEVMASEINENDLIGAQTLANIQNRAKDRGLEVNRDDVRFVLEVVSEPDPWFEQGASANLFAGRFRNFVVARCRGQGLNLSADELDLIDAWFAGGALPLPSPATGAARPGTSPASAPASAAGSLQGAAPAPPPPAAPALSTPPTAGKGHRIPAVASEPDASGSGGRWWSRVTSGASGDARHATDGDELPRFVRSRQRG